jgi:type I restriction-modification system DNA methylase subunit
VAISNTTITTRKLRPYLAKCGYKGDLIQEDYAYSDSSGNEHNVPIAGFAYPSRDARDACIAAVDRDLLAEPTFESVANECRDIGAPVLFFCCRKELQWWTLKSSGVVREDTIPAPKVSSFFTEHQEDFSPKSIYRAKNLSRVHSEYQLKFVDQRLMPILEHEMGNRLADLIKNMLRALDDELESPKGIELKRWMFQCAFWLLGAKILQDKEVKSFIGLDLENVTAVLERVNRHYGVKNGLVFKTRRQQRALEAASKLVKCFSSLNNLTIESLAHVYETTLIDKETRKAWGIHATPSYLVDYIVWQLFDWIRDIPQENRNVLEPTCGHAPFLKSALRLLREIYEGDRADLHKYLNSHLWGIEQGLFAREIARLSLTLADVPNPNGWGLKECDVYEGDILSKLASKSTILLCNPPFENFSPGDKKKCHNLKTGNKAAEVLTRTLPYMPKASVFGVILPQGFRDKKNLADLRKYILDNFELRTICNLPDNVFEKAGHPSTVLLGRKVQSRKNISYLTIPKTELEAFANNYQAKEKKFSKEIFYEAENYSFKVIELREIWDYCRENPKFQKYAIIGRGIEYKDFDNSVKEYEFPGAVKGYANFEKVTGGANPKKVDLSIAELPDLSWMSLKEDHIENPRYGKQCGIPQILTSYLRTGRGVWRIKGLLELDGLPLSNKLIAIRPISLKGDSLSLYSIWALVNSPFTNAYMFCHCRRQNLEGTLREMPVPFEGKDLSRLETMARKYFEIEHEDKFELQDESTLAEKKTQYLLAIDAEILRLYDLPPKLERQLLDFFAGHQRKGADFRFDRYFPEDFESWIPLHEYLSEEYQRSTPSFVNEWVEKNRSPEVIRALKAAVEAFED